MSVYIQEKFINRTSRLFIACQSYVYVCVCVSVYVCTCILTSSKRVFSAIFKRVATAEKEQGHAYSVAEFA